MPIYEYRCDGCGHQFEDVCSSAEADQTDECPKCGKSKVKRLVSSFATAGDSKPDTAGCSSGAGFF